jgi:succinyl-diaminopimelate desuccinylase
MRNVVFDAAALAAELIRRPSVTPRDEGALDVVAGALEAVGFVCHRLTFGGDDGSDAVANLYARYGTGRPNLCFAGHTDVVPPGRQEAWSLDPFGGESRDGALWGRGAVDMKGAIAAFIAAAAQRLAEHGDFGGSLSLLITGDEEGAGINGTKKVLEWLADRAEVPDACIVGEPTCADVLGDMIKIGRRGSLTGRLIAHGTTGHTAYPHLADNAAHRLVALLHTLTTTEFDRGSPHFQPSSLQVSTIDIGNPAANVIPDEARAVFNIRFNDCWTGASLGDRVREVLDQAGGTARYTLEVSVGGEAFLAPPGIVADTLVEAIGRVTGRNAELSTTGGTSDARFIQRYCPVAEFGLIGQTMHKVDERVDLADLAALSQIYRTFLDLYFDKFRAGRE